VTTGPRIRSKLALAFGLELALVAAVAAAGLAGLESVRSSFQTAIDRGLEAQRLAVEIKLELAGARRADAEFLQRWPADPTGARLRVAENRRHVGRLNRLIAELERHQATGGPGYPPRRAGEDLVALKPYVNVYAEDFEQAVALMTARAGQGDGGGVNAGAGDQIARKVRAFQANAVVVEPLVDDIAAVGQQEAQVAIAAARAATSRTFWGVMAALAVAMVTGLALAWALGRQISAPLGRLARTVEAIGAGDLGAQAAVDSRDEIGVLAGAFNAMTAQVRGLVGSLEERVREREQAEAEVRRLNAELEARVRARTGELEAANLELEAFTYSVSHDLRTPLRHISGFVYLLHQRSPALDAESLGHLAVIEGSVKRMGALIDALLAFSRIGRAALARAPVDLGALVGEARAELADEIGGRAIRWRVGPLPEVLADRVLLRQVLVNLLSNAVKFTRPRAEAEVEICAAPERARGDEVVFLVRDNGVGFDMSYADKLFGVFKRLHPPEAFEGTGIGLANVERIVRRHGGRVWAEAAPDQGATFFVALPAG
jgi:signal transduction histidine kinase